MNEFSLIDELDSYICISDMDTYEVLYVNKKLRILMNQGGDCRGEKCYEIFQGLSEPCPFCTNGIITREKFYIWQFYNEYLGMECLVKDKIIDWEGRPARLEVTIDIEKEIIPQRTVDMSKANEVISHQSELLKYQKSYLDRLYAALPCGLVHFTQEEPTRILSYNDAIWKILNYASKADFEAVVKKDFLNVVFARDRRFFKNALRRTGSTQKREEHELRMVRQDGSIAYMREILEVVQIPAGTTVLQIVFVDMSSEREKEVKLNSIVGDLPIVLGILEATGESIHVNYISQGWYKMTGYKTEEYLQYNDQALENIICQEDLEAAKTTIQDAITQKVNTEVECRFVKKDGELIWIFIRMILISKRDGKLIYYLVYSDINQIKENEREARKQREIYEEEAIQSRRKYENELHYIETISQNVLCTAKTNITKNKVESYRTNEDMMEKIVGFTADYDDVIKKIVATVVSEQEKKELEKYFSREYLLNAYENGTLDLEVDCRREKENKSFLWIRTQIKLMKEPQTGDLVGFVVERDIDKEMSALSSSRRLLEHMQIVFNKKYCFVIAVDYETDSYDIIQYSQRNRKEIPASGKITGLLSQMYGFYKENSYEILEVLGSKSLLESKFADGKNEWVCEGKADWVCREGETQQNWYEHIVIPVQDKESNKVLYLFTATLINERKEKEEELKSALEQARKAGKAKQEFLSYMSHEIRTPLNGIRGMLDILKEEKAYTNNKLLKNALVSTKHLSSLINDILDMAKIDSGKITLQNNLIVMGDLLEEVTAIVEMMAEEKGIDCTHQLINPLYRAFYADEKRLKQILVNILSNAIKYTQKGGFVRFHISSEQREDADVLLKFVVEDNGQGMSEEFQTRAFEPFERKEEDGQGGTGLGLFISKRLAELMGGSIELVSMPLKGTKVTVTLRARGSKGEESAENDIKHINFNQIRALVVEDNEINRQIVQMQLEHIGMQVDLAFDGEEAVAKVGESKEGNYDIIFMDVMMPRKDGLTAAKEIRKMKRKDVKKIPIVAMTANAFAEDIHKSIESGMNYHLSKPFSRGKVVEIVAKEFK